MGRKLVAILRGLHPHEVPDIVGCLLDAGFRSIEIPLNSPEPFKSIEAAVKTRDKFAPENCHIGAGTVLEVEEVIRLNDCGGTLCVSPNINPDVVKKAVGFGMISMPGVLTPTEAHLALECGATGLKFFPAPILGPWGITAIKTILPKGTQIYAVGGVGPLNFEEYYKAGADGFAVATGLYQPGDTPTDVIPKAKEIIEAYDRLPFDK